MCDVPWHLEQPRNQRDKEAVDFAALMISAFSNLFFADRSSLLALVLPGNKKEKPGVVFQWFGGKASIQIVLNFKF